jgi:hypothetical protein
LVGNTIAGLRARFDFGAMTELAASLLEKAKEHRVE